MNSFSFSVGLRATGAVIEIDSFASFSAVLNTPMNFASFLNTPLLLSMECDPWNLDYVLFVCDLCDCYVLIYKCGERIKERTLATKHAVVRALCKCA